MHSAPDIIVTSEVDMISITDKTIFATNPLREGELNDCEDWKIFKEAAARIIVSQTNERDHAAISDILRAFVKLEGKDKVPK